MNQFQRMDSLSAPYILLRYLGDFDLKMKSAYLGSTETKIGIQRLVWPLHKTDTQINSWSTRFKKKKSCKPPYYTILLSQVGKFGQEKYNIVKESQPNVCMSHNLFFFPFYNPLKM